MEWIWEIFKPCYLHKSYKPLIPLPEKFRIIERMIKLFNWIKKRKTLKSYVKQLPLFLKKRYGKHKRYSEEEIRTSVQLAGFDNSFIEYAYAMFMSRNEFGDLKPKNKDLEDYDTLRKEIAKSFFSGNTSFTIHDVLGSAPIPKRSMRRS